MTKHQEESQDKVKPIENNFKIIVIEDDEGLNRLIRKRLAREGFQVDWAENGKEALTKITGAPSEILLIDYKLPDMTGKELCEELVKNFGKPPHFITMTGFGDEKIAVEMMKMGAKDYIVKEASFIDLLPEKLKQICLIIDKTKKLEEAEGKLHKQSQLLRETGQMAKVGGWELNLENNTVILSETTKNIHEVPSDYSPSLQEAIKFYPPETRPILEQAVERAINDGQKYDLELPFQTAKGRKLWVHTIGMPELKDGKCIRLHGIFQDITTRKQYEKQLLDLNSQLSLAQNIAKLGYWSFDIKTQLPKWTDECFSMYNIPKEKGEPLFHEQKKIVHSDDWELYESSVQKAITDDIPYDIQIRLVHDDGDIVWMRTRGFPRKNSKGEVTELFGIVQDITDFKETEIALQKAKENAEESEVQLRLLFEKSPDFIIISNKKGEIIKCNEATLKFHNFKSVDEFQNYLTFDFYVYPKEREELVTELLKNRHLQNKEVRFKSFGSQVEIDCLVSVEILKSNLDETLFITSIRDISKIKKQENELIKAKENAEKNEFDLNEAQKLSHVGSWQYDVKTQQPLWSEEMLRIWGLENQKQVQNYKQHKKYIHPEDWGKFDTAVDNAIKKGLAYNLELRIFRPNGEERTIITIGEPVHDSKGSVIRLRGTVQDITLLKKAEQELLNSELKFRNIAENVPGLVLRYQSFPDGSGKLLFVSKGVEDIYEISREEALNDVGLLWDRIHPDDLDGYIKSVIEAGKKLSLWKQEHRIHLPDGRIKWLQGIAMPVKQPDGSVVFDTLGVDITDQKRFEKEIIEAKESAEVSEEKFKLLNRLTSEMLLLQDMESIYKFIADNLQKLHPNTIVLNVSIDESIQQSRLEVISGLDNSLLKKIIDVSGFNPIGKTYKLTDMHHNYFRSGNFIEFDGGLAEFSSSEFPAFASEAIEKLIGLHKIYTIGINKDDGLLAAIHFVTYNKQVISDGSFVEVFVKQAGLVLQKKINEKALKKAKEKAEESKKRFKCLIENAPDAVAINDKEGRLIYVSPNAYRHFGYSENELIGHFGNEFTHPEDLNNVLKAIDTIIRNPDHKARVKYRFRKRNGEYRWIETTFANLLDDETIAGIVLNYSDVTEKEQVLKELIIAKEKAEESDRLKSAFLTNMSHEIRTPMNGILGFTNLLVEPDLTGEEQQHYIEVIQKSGDRMLNTVNDIIDISKIEAGLTELSVSEVNINEQLKYFYSFFKPEAAEKGIQLLFKNDLSEQDMIIKTDLEKFNSILTNIIKNAIKFTDRGWIELGCKIKNDKKFSELEFYVKDSGIGIPEGRQTAIFDRFVQADIGDTRAFEGSGLGLAISKAYAEMLGGKIWLESKVDVGSTFYFSLPVQNSENNKMVGTIEESIKQTTLLNKKFKILIAEDDEVSFQHLSIVLKDTAKEIVHAETGIEAVDLCRKNPDIDMVLMDIKMPQLNGYEATRRIREFNKEVIIIAQTAYALSGDNEKAIEAGCNDYITKPLNNEILFEKIRTHLITDL